MGHRLEPTLRVVFAVGSGIVLMVLTLGCGDGYSPTMEYALRDDLLILKTPEQQPTSLDPPGTFAQLAQQISKVPGCTFNPADLKALKRDKDGKEVVQDVTGELSQALDAQFGKPAAPHVGAKDSVEADAIETLQLAPETLAEGSKLYRRNCLHCHGVTGNGQGPTAPWVNPHPRDYRRGLFKFVSTGKGTSGPPNRKPSREDLLRTLRQGIDGTSMPAFDAISGMTFGVLGDKELNHLVSYVIHLSIRGQVEFEVMAALKGGGDMDIATEVPERVGKVVGEWLTWAAPSVQIGPAKVEPTPEETAELDKIVNGPPSDKKLLLAQLGGDSKNPLLNGKPYTEEQIAQLVAKLVADPRTPETKRPLHAEDVETLFRKSRLVSIERGYGAFMQNCAGACHVNFGRQDVLKWDDWGTIVRPANLTLGIYRGGRRPVDLYWRIYSGIPGSGMAALGDALATVKKPVKGADGKETEQEVKEPWRVWDVVNFVQALPYRSMLPGKPKKGEGEAEMPKWLDLQELIHPLRQ